MLFSPVSCQIEKKYLQIRPLFPLVKHIESKFQFNYNNPFCSRCFISLQYFSRDDTVMYFILHILISSPLTQNRMRWFMTTWSSVRKEVISTMVGARVSLKATMRRAMGKGALRMACPLPSWGGSPPRRRPMWVPQLLYLLSLFFPVTVSTGKIAQKDFECMLGFEMHTFWFFFFVTHYSTPLKLHGN